MAALRALYATCVLVLATALPIWPEPSLIHTVNHPKVGVATRLTDEVEPWKILTTLDMVKSMGAAWITEYFPWVYMEPQPGKYNWQHADEVIDAASARGLTVVARIDFVPSWARPDGSTPRYLAEAQYPTFGAFLATFAARYRGKVQYLVVWNEPNLAFEWGYREPDPASYARMLRVVYPLVKAANPDVQVVSAGLAATTAQGGVALDDLTYLQRLYAAGAAPYFDVLGVHSYGDVLPANAPPDPAVIDFRRVELLRQIMVQSGDAGKRVLITESGWNDAPRWIHSVPPGERIANTIEAYKLAAQWPWLLALCIWQFRLPVPTGTPQDYFSFVNTDFTPRAVYDAVGAYARSP